MSFTSYAQNFEDVMLWRALRDVKKGFYIDVGAQDPVVDSVSMAFHEREWRGIHVEPNPQYAESLRGKRIGDVVVQAALSESAGLIPFYLIRDTGISTADPDIAERHRERGFAVETAVVASLPLSAIFDACPAEEIHWLKLDIEGFEAKALSSWGDSGRRPWVVVVESTLPLTQTDCCAAWEPMLLVRGYEPVYFDGLNRFYLSQDKLHLRQAFECPPNVFDDFAASGLSSSPLASLIDRRHREELDAATASHRQVEQALRSTAEHLVSSLEATQALHMEALQKLEGVRTELDESRRNSAEEQSAAAAALTEAAQRAISNNLQTSESHRIELEAVRIDCATRLDRANASLDERVREISAKWAVQVEQAQSELRTEFARRDAAESELALLRSNWFYRLARKPRANQKLLAVTPAGRVAAHSNQHEAAEPNTMDLRSQTEHTSVDDLLLLDDEGFVAAVYVALLRRAPDPSGLRHHLSRVRRGVSKEQVIVDFARSPEGRHTDARVDGLEKLVAQFGAAPNPRRLEWLPNRSASQVSTELDARFHALDNRLARLEIGQSRVSAQLQGIQEALERLNATATRVAGTRSRAA